VKNKRKSKRRKGWGFLRRLLKQSRKGKRRKNTVYFDPMKTGEFLPSDRHHPNWGETPRLIPAWNRLGDPKTVQKKRSRSANSGGTTIMSSSRRSTQKSARGRKAQKEKPGIENDTLEEGNGRFRGDVSCGNLQPPGERREL